MSGTAAPYGLIPVGDQVGVPRPLALANGIASGLAANIFKYQAVKLDSVNGTITPVTATGDKIFGVFAGVEYTPTGQRPAVSPFWPTGATYVANYEKMVAYIWPAWILSNRWKIQSDGSIAQAKYGEQFNLSGFSNGSTVTGLSQCSAAAAGAGAGNQGQLALIEFSEGVSEAVGDAFTDLIVTICYPQNIGGFQTSLA